MPQSNKFLFKELARQYLEDPQGAHFVDTFTPEEVVKSWLHRLQAEGYELDKDYNPREAEINEECFGATYKQGIKGTHYYCVLARMFGAWLKQQIAKEVKTYG